MNRENIERRLCGILRDKLSLVVEEINFIENLLENKIRTSARG